MCFVYSGFTSNNLDVTDHKVTCHMNKKVEKTYKP